MEITRGPKRTHPLMNFFDDEMTITSREMLFDGKSWSELNPVEQKQAVSAAERHHRERMGGWSFLVGLGGFCLLLTAHLTAAGIVIVAALTALLCWAIASKF